jgi:hypothetical protein
VHALIGYSGTASTGSLIALLIIPSTLSAHGCLIWQVLGRGFHGLGADVSVARCLFGELTSYGRVISISPDGTSLTCLTPTPSPLVLGCVMPPPPFPPPPPPSVPPPSLPPSAPPLPPSMPLYPPPINMTNTTLGLNMTNATNTTVCALIAADCHREPLMTTDCH